MVKLFIIVLNFNGGKEVLVCLESLLEVARGPKQPEYGVVVVDNGSQDWSLEEIRKLAERSKGFKIEIIENGKNLGFAAGMNVGIKYALKQGAEAVFLLNQDTIVEKGFLKPLLENKADIVSPVIKFKRDKKWVYDFGGKINRWLGRTSHFEAQDQRLKTKDQIDYVSGCAVLIKRPVLEKIGLLDERYFLYFEDVDFCLRANKAGFKIAVEPGSLITHNLSEKKKKPLKQHFYLLKSNLIFINRHVPLLKKPFAYLYWLLLSVKVFLNSLSFT